MLTLPDGIVPVPLSRIDSLQPQAKTEPDPIAHMIRRKRATKALWIAKNEFGKYIGHLHDSIEGVTKEHGAGSYNIQKLHPVGDIELIKKIRSIVT